MEKIRKAVILCAGFATRFLPETKVVAKELLPLYNKPVVEHIVNGLIDAGVEEICFVIRKGKESILRHFTRDKKWEKHMKDSDKSHFDKYEKIKFCVRYQKAPLGTGNALLSAKDFCDKTFFLLNGDEVIMHPVSPAKQMLDFWTKHKCCVMGVKQVKKCDVTKYGMLDYTQKSKVKEIKKIVEKPPILSTPSTIANIGIYILSPEFLRQISTKTEKEVPITDAINTFVQDHKMHALTISGTRYDMGSPLTYVLSNFDYCFHHPDTHKPTKKWIERYFFEKNHKKNQKV